MRGVRKADRVVVDPHVGPELHQPRVALGERRRELEDPRVGDVEERLARRDDLPDAVRRPGDEAGEGRAEAAVADAHGRELRLRPRLLELREREGRAALRPGGLRVAHGVLLEEREGPLLRVLRHVVGDLRRAHARGGRGRLRRGLRDVERAELLAGLDPIADLHPHRHEPPARLEADVGLLERRERPRHRDARAPPLLDPVHRLRAPARATPALVSAASEVDIALRSASVSFHPDADEREEPHRDRQGHRLREDPTPAPRLLDSTPVLMASSLAPLRPSLDARRAQRVAGSGPLSETLRSPPVP